MRTWAQAIVVIAAAFSASCHNESVSVRTTAARPNIVLVTIDTWRADRLRPDLTPNLHRLAESGVTFTAARSAVPLTLPSHATMMTGLLPAAHGVRENGVVLGESQPTIAQMLKENGYRTAAFIGAFVLDRRFGLARGFDVYDDRIPRNPNATEALEAERPASAVVDAALRWLPPSLADTPSFGAAGRLIPFFVWIHLYDPHAPYHGGYDSEIASVDRQLARVFERVGQRAIIVVAGDHGEGLGEHGERTHGMLLYDSTLRVPLFVAGAGVKPEKRNDAVSLVDLSPTILRLAGVPPPRELTGRDLMGSRQSAVGGRQSAVGGRQSAVGGADIYAETEYPHVAGWSALQALTDGRWKAIRAGGATEIYDLASDPGEQRNVSAAQSSTAAAMAARIDAIRASGPTGTSKPVSAEARERLRALGYVASSAQPSTGSNAANPADAIADWNAFEDALAVLSTNPKNALPALKALAERHRDAQLFQTTYARAIKDAGQPALALARYRAAAKRWPTDPALLHDLAVAAREAGQVDEAVKADQAALALEPGSPTARNGLGLLAIDQGRPQDAIREFTQAAQLDPNNASYWANLGNAKRASGDAPGAEQAYRKALELDARLPDAANGLGVLLVEAKRPAEAVPWFERALEQPPVFVEAQLNLGIALQQSGNPARAAEAYRAILANPSAPARERNAARALLASIGGAR